MLTAILLALRWAARLWAGLGPWEEGTMPEHDTCDQAPGDELPGGNIHVPGTLEALWLEWAEGLMHWRCDRCGARTLTTWQHGRHTLGLCGTHSRTNGKALASAGWKR